MPPTGSPSSGPTTTTTTAPPRRTSSGASRRRSGGRRAGFKASDFRIPTLKEVLRAFPHTPINIEIKGRTPAEADAEYVLNAEILARTLKRVKRRDLIVVSFKQKAVDRFHQLRPRHRSGARDRRRGRMDRGRLAGTGREGVPGADHVRGRRRADPDHDEGRTSRGRTARATRGRTGSAAPTRTLRTRGGRSSTHAWTGS